ncbi:hypothetical protein, partial [Enterococcus sp. DIV0660C]|uniref:hypothetical protein n=1 Tax=Enterococcus sp. DIV0660C TaxID=2230880 RepID=UPI001A8E0E0F
AINEVKKTDTKLTGNVNEQDVEAGRTYELKATLNDKEIGTIKVEAGKEFSMDLPEGTTLNEGDKVAVQVVGHQAGKEDKVSEQAKQTVVDGTNWSDWQVNAPTLNEVKTTDTKLTGNVNEQDVEAGRTYELKATLNDKEIGTIKVEAGKEFSMDLPEGTTLNEGDKVAVQVVGHQAGKEDKSSKTVEQVVQSIKHPTISEFDKGYWRNYGLVFEGKIDNEDWDLSDASHIQKQGLIYDESGKVVKEMPAANHNWYDPARYNGYQVIVDNDVLGELVAGNYTIGMRVTIDGQVMDELPLQIKPQMTRMGPIHNDFNDLEQVTLKQNTIKPGVINNTPGFNVSTSSETEEVHLFNKYWNDEDQLVFDGYFMNVAHQGTTKKLQITDKKGQEVYQKAELEAAPDSWGVPTGVADDDTFQAIIPIEFRDQSQYDYTISLITEDGTEVFTHPLV